MNKCAYLYILGRFIFEESVGSFVSINNNGTHDGSEFLIENEK